MRPSAAVHDALAELLEYPRRGHAARCRELALRIAAEIPEAAADLAPLVRLAEETDLGSCEESYVRTFDVNAERALEVGWQVFGEQYARGAFLVRMRDWMRREGVAETSELPDHLTQVLRVLGRVPEDDARMLVGAAVVPSLARIRKALAGEGPYEGVLEAVARALAWAAGPEGTAPAAPSGAAVFTPASPKGGDLR
jgi:nitrate reductase assembly molybdenum cofactor insertion protein NarJ